MEAEEHEVKLDYRGAQNGELTVELPNSLNFGGFFKQRRRSQNVEDVEWKPGVERKEHER